MKSALIVTLVLCFATYGCAGRAPNPVQSYQYGDEKKSCNALRAEISNTESEVQRKLPDSDKTGTNVVLGIAGAFLLVPWFFMDFSRADQVEIEALRRRYNTLVILSAEKSCGFDYKEIPDFKKPPDQPVETKS